jgi:hypothetical protein
MGAKSRQSGRCHPVQCVAADVATTMDAESCQSVAVKLVKLEPRPWTLSLKDLQPFEVKFIRAQEAAHGTPTGGLILPNSEAELAAHRNASAEFIKESARYNEAVNSRSRSGSLKRSHRDLNSGNGNSINNSDNHVNRGCARSQGQGAPQLPRPNEVAQTTPNSVTKTMSNSVPQTMQTAQQALGDEFLCDFNSLNHPAQLDTIKDLDREQRERGTPVARRVEIRSFLQNVEVTDHVEGPVAKKINLSKNGKLAYEVLILHSSKDKQLALTNDDFNAIMAEAMVFIRTLGGEIDPEWNWQSWSNYRGRIEVASEIQAQMVTAMFNGLEVAGVPAFRLWRAHEIVELTSVKLKLDQGHLYKVDIDEIIQGLLRKHRIKGTYSEPRNIMDGDKRHVIFFMADPTLRDSLGKCQNGSATFFLNLWGMDRELYMARDPLIVAAEEAAVMRLRVETALAKAIAASDRLALIPVEPAAATTGGEEEPPKQQQGNLNNDYNNSLTRNPENYSYLGPVAPAMSEFMRHYQQVQQDHREQRERQQQQHEQEQQRQQHQQLLYQHQQVELFQQQQQLLQQPGALTPDQQHHQQLQQQQHQQQQQQQQGKAKFSIIKYLIDKQNTYPPGVVKDRIASIEEQAASPPHGVDPQTLVGGLPPATLDSSFSSTSSSVSVVLRKQKQKTNTSTGSAEVDGLDLKMGDDDMDVNKEEDAELYQLAKDNSDMEEGGGTA